MITALVITGVAAYLFAGLYIARKERRPPRNTPPSIEIRVRRYKRKDVA